VCVCASTVEHGGGVGGGCIDAGGMLPPGVNATNTATPGDILTPKKQAVVDRLRRRIENYRKRQTEFMPRFGQSFNGIVEQNIQETLLLKQKFLENKSKRSVKKQEKKQSDPVTNLIAVSFFKLPTSLLLPSPLWCFH